MDFDAFEHVGYAFVDDLGWWINTDLNHRKRKACPNGGFDKAKDMDFNLEYCEVWDPLLEADPPRPTQSARSTRGPHVGFGFARVERRLRAPESTASEALGG